MAIQVPAESMTYEEFLRAYDGQHAEWVRGKVVVMSPVSWSHQEIVLFLVKAMDAFLDRKPLGKVSMAPYQMRIKSSDTAREPDILFVSKERIEIVKESYLDGPA